MNVVTTPQFNRELKKLIRKNKIYKAKTNRTLSLLQYNFDHPSLRVHKLAGKDIYSISVDLKIRILIHIYDSDAYLLRIGTHDEIY